MTIQDQIAYLTAREAEAKALCLKYLQSAPDLGAKWMEVRLYIAGAIKALQKVEAYHASRE